MTPPTLQTARLVLRPMILADFPAIAAFLATDRSQYMGGPCDLRGAWGWFCHDVALWSLAGHGALMIEAGGAVVGQVGINAGPLFPETELGWWLYDGHEGRGYATEAAAALRDWAFAHLSVDSLVSYVDPANLASARVALRLGAVLDPDAPRQAGDDDDLVFRHLRGAA
ncbi:MAG: GNAT family N-acetyltransferase [Alphaproteobacteria bacterium]|jgi:RimJ/RimL family protein N-acetyltransferase